MKLIKGNRIALYIILSRGFQIVLLLDNTNTILSCPSLLVDFRFNDLEAVE